MVFSAPVHSAVTAGKQPDEQVNKGVWLSSSFLDPEISILYNGHL